MPKQEEKHKKNFKEGGITLIALVITIIVLLILAGVTLAMLTGDSGILSNAEKAKEDTLQANVKEKVQLAIMEYEVGQYSGGKTLKEYLEDADATEISPVANKGIIDGYVFEIEDGEVTVTKGTSYELKLKDVYTEEMIGQEINYQTTNTLPTDVKWIVIGQDDNGNVVVTTSRPLGAGAGEANYLFTLTGGVESWLNYETDLNTKCAELFAGTVQDVEVKVESIDRDHISALTGFVEPELNIYTFKDQETNDYKNKVVNYYHPDADAENKWSKVEKTYQTESHYVVKTNDSNNVYYGTIGWEFEGNTTKYPGTLKNLDLVLGPNYNELTYAIANTTVGIYSDKALFVVGAVGNGFVGWYGSGVCSSDSTSFNNNGDTGVGPIRPVVYLSSDFIVEKQENGTYQLAE